MQRTLVPTELGLKVFDFLIANLEALFDVQFTAGMEEQLDAIEEGQVGWQDMLTTFNEKFQEWLKTARGPAGDRQAVVKMLDALESVKEWQAPMTRGSKTATVLLSLRGGFDVRQTPVTPLSYRPDHAVVIEDRVQRLVVRFGLEIVQVTLCVAQPYRERAGLQ